MSFLEEGRARHRLALAAGARRTGWTWIADSPRSRRIRSLGGRPEPQVPAPRLVRGMLGTLPDMTDLRPGVLFDVDGTLLDTNYLHVLAWWQAMRDTGHDRVSMAAIHRAIGIASEGLVEHLLGHADDGAVQAHSERYEALREGQLTAFPRTAELVRRCAEAGYVPVVATSGKREDLDWMLPAIGAEDSVAGATTSSEVDDGKPSPDLLTAALEQHRLDARRSVVVGDTVWDVKAAAKAGVPCVAVTCGGISEAELREAGAVEVYHDPADLLDRFDESRLGRMTASAPGRP